MNDFYSTGTYKHDSTTFSGLIYNYDYDGYNSMTDIAGRILSDMRFDKKCKLFAEKRNRNKKYKNNRGEK